MAAGADSSNKLYREWTYWELRARDAKMGISNWRDQYTPLYSFGTIPDFLSFWVNVPKITDVFDREGYDIKRVARQESDASGRTREIVTKAEGYMLFRKGVEPSTEYEVSPGVRATQNRRRAELSVRARDFDNWWKAWELTVMAIIGESVDPLEYIVGAYLTDKKSKNGVALRLELWFSTKDDDICDAIAGELGRILAEKLPDLPFRFLKTSYDKKKSMKEGDALPAASPVVTPTTTSSDGAFGGPRLAAAPSPLAAAPGPATGAGPAWKASAPPGGGRGAPYGGPREGGDRRYDGPARR
jgi:hypothetical protein